MEQVTQGAAAGSQPLRGLFALVVDDDRGIRDELREYLQKHGMQVEVAADAITARHHMQLRKFDILLLDLWLGNDNGFDFLREVRRGRDIPCIMMTAQDDVMDKIVGLELGADDYLFKPVNPRELLARMRALLRRANFGAASPESTAPMAPKTSGGTEEHTAWHFDPKRRNLSAPDGRPVPLTTAECDLLIELAANEGSPQKRDDLCRRVFGREWQPYDRSLDGVIVKLRRKLETDPDNPMVIKTVRGKGYVFTGFPSSSEDGTKARAVERS